MVLEITLAKLSCSQRNDCGTADNSFKRYHVCRVKIVVQSLKR